MASGGLYAANRYRATILRWVDGDTVELLVDLGQSVHRRDKYRLARIDAPETTLRSGVTPQEKQEGLALKEYVAERWPAGTPCEIQTVERGKFGRYVVEIVVLHEGLPLNISTTLYAMIAEGDQAPP